jgi:hypothetical protein
LIIDLVNEIKKKSLTIEEVKDDLIDEYVKLTNNFTDNDRIYKIIDILKEEGQIDASQLQDGSMNFEQLIIQQGFLATNFDLWILLVKYEIPSIFISSKNIAETRYKLRQFVCYDNSSIDKNNKYVFICAPAMYRRTKKYPEYKLIIDNKDKIEIDIDELKEGECLNNIEDALNNYITIEDYLDVIFEKNIQKPKDEDFDELNIVKKKRKIANKKMKPTLILKEEEEVFEIPKEDLELKEKSELKEEKELNIKDIIFPEEEKLEIIPVRKEKKKTRKQKIKVNPHGKKSTTKRKLPENIEILDVMENIN